jgi:hypothetical protein
VLSHTHTHKQSATALQPIVFLTGIERLLVTSKGRVAALSANHRQGQLKTPQSLSVATHCASCLLLSFVPCTSDIERVVAEQLTAAHLALGCSILPLYNAVQGMSELAASFRCHLLAADTGNGRTDKQTYMLA